MSHMLVAVRAATEIEGAAWSLYYEALVERRSGQAWMSSCMWRETYV